MRKAPLKGTPVIKGGKVWISDLSWMSLDTPEWFHWLLGEDRFRYEGEEGTFSARREKRQRGGNYWFAYRRVDGKLYNVYLGRTAQLTQERLRAAAVKLQDKAAGAAAVQKGAADKRPAVPSAEAGAGDHELQKGDLAILKAGYEAYWKDKFGKASHFKDDEMIVVRERHILADTGKVSVFIRNVDDPKIVGAAPEEYLTAAVEVVRGELATPLDERDLSVEAARAIARLDKDGRADLLKAARYLFGLGGAAYADQMIVERDADGIVRAFPNSNRLTQLLKRGFLAYVTEPDDTKRYRLSPLGVEALRIFSPGMITPLVTKVIAPIPKRRRKRLEEKSQAVPRPAGQPAPPTYQFKVALLGIYPLVWRRFRVPGDIDFEDLHQVIQSVMGWESFHLYQFFVGYHCIGGHMAGNADRYTDEKIARYVGQEQRRWGYQYDFGDLWECEVVLERILKEPIRRPVCLAGKRACPPEDSGGPDVYRAYLEGRKRKRVPGWIRERVGRDHDPAEFDLKAVNRELREYWADRAQQMKKAKQKA